MIFATVLLTLRLLRSVKSLAAIFSRNHFGTRFFGAFFCAFLGTVFHFFTAFLNCFFFTFLMKPVIPMPSVVRTDIGFGCASVVASPVILPVRH